LRVMQLTKVQNDRQIFLTTMNGKNMTEDTNSTNKHALWHRGLIMLLMIFIFQITGTVILVVMLFQFVMGFMVGGPLLRLVSFGRSLAIYIQQIASFLTYSSEEIPFPFSDWPAGEK
jgi:hypothetical protein